MALTIRSRRLREMSARWELQGTQCKRVLAFLFCFVLFFFLTFPSYLIYVRH